LLPQRNDTGHSQTKYCPFPLAVPVSIILVPTISPQNAVSVLLKATIAATKVRFIDYKV
jgi:hypothetical protein